MLWVDAVYYDVDVMRWSNHAPLMYDVANMEWRE